MGSKTKLHPVILAALIGGAIAFLLSQLQFRVWIESPEVVPFSVPSPTPSSLPVGRPAKPKPDIRVPPVPDALRVSNQTPNAVRVVLLARSSSTAYLEPVHWDFAPDEGSQQGLILSLPEGNLRLQQGDIVTAFALDGSHRYWGPYVAGKTADPAQQGQRGEWQLILRP